jgi:hypothetical protein
MERRIQFIFALLSAALIWRLNPPGLLQSLATYLGLQTDGRLYSFVEGVSVPVLFTAFAFLIIGLSDRVTRNRKDRKTVGTWIYICKVDQTHHVSVFTIQRKSKFLEIKNGYVCVFERGELFERARWDAEAVYFENEAFSIDYIARVIPQSGVPEHIYHGRFLTHHFDVQPIVGIECYKGIFQDHNDNTTGPVYCEFVGPRTDQETIRQKFLNCSSQLIARLPISNNE